MAVIEQDVVFTTKDANGNTVIQMPITRAENVENVMSIEQGGTGATTVAAVRKNLGLGNTSGAVPIANGGTGATTAAAARKNLGITDILLDYCYPVGSLYWSKNATNPGTLFGGTWTQVKDKFVLAAGDSYAQGATGGAATVTLTTNQIPSHTHTGSTAASTIPEHYHAFGYNNANNNGTFIATSAAKTFNLISSSGTRGWNGSGGGGGYDGDKTTYSGNMITSKSTTTSGSTGSHSHTVTINSTGGGAAHNNMPPYVTYYCWERTA